MLIELHLAITKEYQWMNFEKWQYGLETIVYYFRWKEHCNFLMRNFTALLNTELFSEISFLSDNRNKYKITFMAF